MLDPKTLILRRQPDKETQVRYGRRKTIERKLKHYRVETRDGALVGCVFESMATFETRSKGKRYVNTRWESPRWYYSLRDEGWRRSRIFETSRARALAELIATYEREEQPAA